MKDPLYNRIATSCAALLVASSLAGSVAYAVEAPSDSGSVMEEIVVTSQKREQKLQDVGISITAFTGTQLRALGVTKSVDVASLSPGVFLSGSLAGQNTQFTIRGVTQNDFNDIVEAPNAVYLDDGYIAIAAGQTFASFDIQRVEILKGPQGTLFGRNATGGLINYITNKPNLTTPEAYFDVSYGLLDAPGTKGEFHGDSAISIPLSPKVAARLAVSWNKRDAYWRNTYPAGAVGGSPGAGAGANMGDDDTLAERFTILAKPSDDLTITLSGNNSRSHFGVGPYTQKATIGVFDANGELVNVLDAGPNETRASIAFDGSDHGSDLGNRGIFGAPFGRAPGADFFGYHAPDPKTHTLSSDFSFSNIGHMRARGVNGRVEYRISDAVSLTSVTDYKDFNKLMFIDVDAGPGNQLANYGGDDAKTFSQELRLNGATPNLNWVAGLYYLHIKNHSDNGLKIPLGSVAPGPIDIASLADLKTNSYSAFGQFDYKFADKMTIVLGGRIIKEKKDYDFTQAIFLSLDSTKIQQGAPLAIIGPDNGQPYHNNMNKTLWAGKAQLEYRPNTDLLVYGGVNRGTKAGSFNAQLAGGLAVSASAIPYRDETLTSYEGGFKYTLPDGKTRINGSAYIYDYKNYQSFLFTGVSGVVVNANARNIGAELEITTNPIRGLDLSLSGAWSDAKVRNVPLRIGGPISRDVRPTYAPQFQGNAMARYEWDALTGKANLRARGHYASSYYYNLRNFDADKFKSTFVVDLGAGWATADNHWDIHFDVRNVTNTLVPIQGFDLATLCGCNEISYQAPRQYVLGLRYNY
jgi:iron complex outermembrane receptor protein